MTTLGCAGRELQLPIDPERGSRSCNEVARHLHRLGHVLQPTLNDESRMTAPYIPGLLLDGEWAPPFRASGDSLADIIGQAGSQLFPDHHLTTFDLPLVREQEDPVRVDLALVSKDLQSWYLVFVIPSKDVDMESLVSRIRSAENHLSGIREAQELADQINDLELAQALELVRNSPVLIVVTDDPRHSWGEQLAASNAKVHVMIVEPFFCGGRYAFRVNGDVPTTIDSNVVATCESHPTLPNCLVVHWNNSTSMPDRGPITLGYGDLDTQWEHLHGVSTSQLQSIGTFLLPDAARFEIVGPADGLWTIRVIVS